MSLHRLAATQRLPVSPEEAWRFFADPRNLAVMTPPDLRFELTNEVPAQMHPGLIIAYRIRPMFGVPSRWVTEITHLEEGSLFVDEQRLGPYRFWHHQHHFRAIEGGVEVRDIVHYDIGVGPLGDLVDLLVVRRRLRAIFEFRRRVLAQRFGEVHVPAG